MSNLAEIVGNAAGRYGNRVALRQGDLAMTYSELAQASGKIGGLLREAGVRPGDRVALMMPNVLAYPVLFYGILAASGVVVPMNPLLKSREVAHYLGDSGASVIFAWDSAAGEAAEGASGSETRVIGVTDPDAAALTASRAPLDAWAERADDDDAVILYTSGTTGRPKGAQL